MASFFKKSLWRDRQCGRRPHLVSGQGMVVHVGLHMVRQDLISVSLGIEVAQYIHEIKLAVG